MDPSHSSKLSIARWALLVVALLLVAVSWWQVWQVRSGLQATELARDGVPMRFIRPEGEGPFPSVLIAHGFGGSQQLMLAYAYTLAHAGYATLSWDFGGHAANPAPLDREGDSLQADLDAAYAALTAQPEVDTERVALLGHSMGSGAVMSAGVRDPERYKAVVAVSPTGADVSPQVPPNLLLQAGEREPRFVANAERLLLEAGGTSSAFDAGRARDFILVPEVEHITILFSAVSHRAALEWVNQSFGLELNTDYVDQRILWYALHLLGWLLGLVAVSPLLPKSAAGASATGRVRGPVLGLLLAPLVAGGLLFLVNLVLDVAQLGGVLVGGGFALWAFFFGLTWLLLGYQRPRLAIGGAAWGLVVFVFLWVAVGLLAQYVWLPWYLIPSRLVLWPLMALAFFPWMWAAGLAQEGRSVWRRALWWLGQTLAIIGGVLLVLQLVPAMGVLILVLPLIPVLLGVMTLVGAVIDRPLAAGIGNALFFGWLVMVYFPLA